MKTLSERLKEGQGADRELNWEIHKLFWPGDRDLIPPAAQALTPAFTSHLNAVFALVERELPDWVASCDATVPTCGIDWQLEPPAGVRVTQSFKGVCFGESSMNISAHCRALLLALLAATQKE